MPDASIAGVVLTGGRSRRMGGVIKAHELLGGKPLIQHVIDRVKPQVGRLVLSVEKVSGEFTPYGLEQLADPEPGSCGPLGGLLSALSTLDAGCDWLLLAPCDAPLLPLDLAVKLERHAVELSAEGWRLGPRELTLRVVRRRRAVRDRCRLHGNAAHGTGGIQVARARIAGARPASRACRSRPRRGLAGIGLPPVVR